MYEIVNLKPIDMAIYFEKAFNSKFYRELIEQSDSISTASTHFINIGNILRIYVTSTGDLSEESMNKLIYDYSLNYEKLTETSYFNFSKKHESDDYLDKYQIYFKDYILPMIIDVYKTRINIREPLSYRDMIRVQIYMLKHSKNNIFLTHSFSAALLERINQYGLDSRMELFEREYQSLIKLTGHDTPYKRGKVFLCELSNATFRYTERTPERLHTLLGTYGVSRKDIGTSQDYYTRCLKFKLEHNKKLSLKEKKQIYEDVKKMIDFYYIPQKNCIAFKKEEKPFKSEDVTKYFSDNFIRNMTKYCLNEFDNRGYGNEYEVDKLDRSTFEIATIPDIFDIYSLNVQNRNVEKTIQK